MRPVSTGFIEASLSPVGFADAYLDINGTRIDASKLTEITVNENIGASGSFSIGSFNTVEATMKVLTSALPSTVAGMPIRIYFGYYVSGSYEYVPMGIFYAQPKDISHQNLFTTINAHDKSWRMTDAYVSALNWDSTHTVREVLNEVATSAEITLGTFGGLNPSNVTVYTAPKGSYRDVIAQMAMLLGTNAKLNRAGALDFIKAYPSSAVEEYGAYDYTSSGFSITSDASANYGKLTVNYKTTNSSGEEQVQTFNYTAGSGSNALVIESTNIRTQAQTNTLGQTIFGTTGLQYYGYTANLPGQPQIDLGDTISIEDVFGRTNNLLVLQATHTFNGAMKSTFNAIVNDSEPELNGNNISGSLTEQVSTINDAASYARGRAEYAASKADEASASASRAQKSADDAQKSADDAQASADEADRQAGIATDNATEAKEQAGVATRNATEAIRQAGIATTSANEAKEQAHTATTYANSALDQLGIVQDVIGVLNWATEHGTFTATTDTTVQEGKVYFTYDSQTGDYTPVVTPADNPQAAGYYELTVDEAMESFIMSHLAVTGRGLWVLPNGIGSDTTPESGESQEDSDARQGENYKVLLASDGLYIYDGDGVLVSKYGESITFSSTRQQTIGNNQAYIVFDPEGASGQGTLTIGGATINMSGKTLDEILAEKLDSVDVSVTQTSTGADITVNGDTVSIANGRSGSSIWTTNTAPTGSYIFNISSLSGPSGETPKVGDLIVYSYYRYTIASVSSATVTAGSRTSIRGATGESSKWYSGTGITGTSTTATVFPNSGVSSAVVGDMYLNTSTGNTYRCTTAGAASAAKWVYASNVTGPQGSQGPKGDQGPQGVSVTSLTPYYQLGTSKPAKPSDNTQPTGWSTTQPAVDTTKTCYVTVQAIYSNGDIKYSDVSTLSEYEASKSVIELSLVNSASVNGAWYYQYSPTVSGAIASFKAIGGNAINSIVSNIDVVQSGSGDPSPTNVRALSGRSIIHIFHSGKNLLKNKRQAGETFVAGDVTFAIQRDGRVIVNGATGDAAKYMAINNGYRIPATTILTGCPSGGSSTTYEIQVANNGYTTRRDYGSGVEVLPRPAPDIYLYLRSGYTANNLTFAPMLRLEGTDPTYEPFIGSVSNISLGQTVYKGTFDATNGTLTVTHKIYDVTFASRTSTTVSGKYRFSTPAITGIKKPTSGELPDMYCNRLPVNTSTNVYNAEQGVAIHSSDDKIYVYISELASMTLAEAQAWLEENPIQVVYPLETPEVYNVDSIQSVALAGDNNIWSSTGDVSVEYIIDVTYDGSEYYYILGSEKTVVDPSDLDKDGDTLVTVYRDGLGDRINNVQNDVIKAQSTADEADAKADSANTKANEVNTALEDYKDSNDKQIGILRERLVLEESVSSDLGGRTEQAEKYIKALQKSYDKYDSFIEIKTEGDSSPSISLGKRNDTQVKSKVEITATSVNIWSEDKITAYASGQAFNAPEGVFENVTMVNANGSGKLRWIARSNGHLSLKVVE